MEIDGSFFRVHYRNPMLSTVTFANLPHDQRFHDFHEGNPWTFLTITGTKNEVALPIELWHRSVHDSLIVDDDVAI